MAAPRFFASAAAFRAWLRKHAATATELAVGFYKVGSGRPSMTWPESVDEALCFGWIDGVRRRIDDDAYQIRFTPRRPGSTWSAINIAKVRDLAAAGRMTPAGLAAFEARTDAKSAIYAYEQREAPELAAEEIRLFKRHRAAWQWFQQAQPGYRRVATHWVVSAKKPETRARRLALLVAACAEGRKLAR
jgi:uncharacterized protein YdeI (YjbR/CyaY-like superfamily)